METPTTTRYFGNTRYSGNLRFLQKNKDSLKMILQHEVITDCYEDNVLVKQKVEWVSVPLVFATEKEEKETTWV
jgi:hypothetical protein